MTIGAYKRKLFKSANPPILFLRANQDNFK